MFVKEAALVSDYVQHTVLLIVSFNELKHFCGLYVFYDKTSIGEVLWNCW